MNIFPNDDEFTTDELLEMAHSTEASEEDLGWLSTSREQEVAYAIIKNPNTPYRVLRALANSSQHDDTLYDHYYYEGVAEYAQSVIDDRFPDLDAEDYA